MTEILGTGRGILVDMDGTTVDSNAVVEGIWAEFCEKYDVDLAELLVFSHGRLMKSTLRHFLPAASESRIEAIAADMEKEELTRNDMVRPIEGARNFLEALNAKNIPWALVTSAPPDLARVRYRVAQLPWPKVVVTADRVRVGKPSPEGYLMAAAEIGVQAEQCMVFEDAGPGIEAGIAAGATVVAVGDANVKDYAVAASIPNFAGLRIEERSDGLVTLYR